MKITAYEVRPDEKDYLLAAAQQEQIEITLVQGPMTQDNIDRAEGADGITILGDTKMDAALIEETAKRRIRVVATRTIGYDHIDLEFGEEQAFTSATATTIRTALPSIRSC